MNALRMGRAQALSNAYGHLEGMLLLLLWCVELSWGLVGDDGQLTGRRACCGESDLARLGSGSGEWDRELT
jgi:hypothetical protein